MFQSYHFQVSELMSIAILVPTCIINNISVVLEVEFEAFPGYFDQKK